ncbi:MULTISPECIES: CopG family transcriptional regulator [unclassified Sphingomonas]|uniref:CopG family transcriptional regulator n=1 Tax=unclassified Sphingomonas TaxID=196159 RepID=UPI002151131D|nr:MULTISPECIES: CopG family transcriptional regulator [unclassified Sphingomonas]MCR5869564.1 CopG family transcriptional regulator [Sphingomonas sp. J344]UUX98720.1 CopG family transcriptional regulator [Sphingomonas sp. J315]
MARKVRYQLFLSLPLSERLEALAAKPGVTRSALLAQALETWLTRLGTNELDDRFGPRLDRLSAALGRLERGQEVLLESLALFIRYELAIHAPLAENDHAGRAIARERFEAFVAQVGRQIAAGRHTLDNRARDGR